MRYRHVFFSLKYLNYKVCDTILLQNKKTGGVHMKCKICGKNAEKRIQIRRGYLCQSCFDKLPDSVKANAKNVTTKQLKKLLRIVHEPSEPAKLQIGFMYLGMSSLWLHGRAIRIEDIRNISWHFHPIRAEEKGNICYGVVGIVIETRQPYFVLEEPLYDHEIRAEYHISGHTITYSLPLMLEIIIMDIRKAIETKQNDFSAVIHKCSKREYSYHHHKNQSRSNSHSDRSRHNQTGSGKPDVLRNARNLYGLQDVFTREQLNREKRKLTKKYHPDICHDENAKEMMQMVLTYYKLLLP